MVEVVAMLIGGGQEGGGSHGVNRPCLPLIKYGFDDHKYFDFMYVLVERK